MFLTNHDESWANEKIKLTNGCHYVFVFSLGLIMNQKIKECTHSQKNTEQKWIPNAYGNCFADFLSIVYCTMSIHQFDPITNSFVVCGCKRACMCFLNGAFCNFIGNFKTKTEQNALTARQCFSFFLFDTQYICTHLYIALTYTIHYFRSPFGVFCLLINRLFLFFCTIFYSLYSLRQYDSIGNRKKPQRMKNEYNACVCGVWIRKDWRSKQSKQRGTTEEQTIKRKQTCQPNNKQLTLITFVVDVSVAAVVIFGAHYQKPPQETKYM